VATTLPNEQEAPQKRAREPEPRVLTIDVQRVLQRVVRPDLDDAGESVVMLAERARTSARTVYRVLARTTDSINLDLADRLCLAADAHLSECSLVWPDGRTTKYYI
jgi:hypothetical protein